MLRDGLERRDGAGGRGAQEERDRCILIANSHCWAAELTQHYKAIMLQLKQ